MKPPIPPCPVSPGPDAGFAVVSALAAVMLFALVAYAILAEDRGVTAEVAAQVERAKLEAAADGATATVAAQLAAHRWDLSDPPHVFLVDDIEITGSVEDERGKISINGANSDQIRRLLAGAGVSGARLDQMTASILNWLDGGERPDGAKMTDYLAIGERERHGRIRSLGELMAIQGMDEATFERVSPALTLFFGNRGRFDHRTASPLAAKVMAPERMDAAGTAIVAFASEDAYVGRPFSVHVTARDGHGGVFKRTSIIEFTGRPRQPLWIRAVD